MAEGVAPPPPSPGSTGPAGLSSTLDEFLDQIVNDYLLADLRSMKRVSLEPGEKTGECSYAIVLAVLVGCELLGRLDGAPEHGEVERYWTKYMPTPYRSLGAVARALVRNGLAHIYSTKANIVITKGDPENRHLLRDESGVFYVDCLKLAEDFESSYPGARENIAANIGSAADLREILDDAWDDYEQYKAAIESVGLTTPLDLKPQGSEITGSGVNAWQGGSPSPPGPLLGGR
jgi:hypothetical protein